MPITTHIDKSKDVTVFNATGTVDFYEIVNSIKSFLNGDQTIYTLWNLLAVTDITILPEQVETIATLPILFQDKRGQGKAAIVADKSHLFGLARQLGIHAEVGDLPYPIEVFDSIKEAYQWFDEP